MIKNWPGTHKEISNTRNLLRANLYIFCVVASVAAWAVDEVQSFGPTFWPQLALCAHTMCTKDMRPYTGKDNKETSASSFGHYVCKREAPHFLFYLFSVIFWAIPFIISLWPRICTEKKTGNGPLCVDRKGDRCPLVHTLWRRNLAASEPHFLFLFFHSGSHRKNKDWARVKGKREIEISSFLFIP